MRRSRRSSKLFRCRSSVADGALQYVLLQTKAGKIGAEGVYFDPAAWGQPTCVCFGNTRLGQFIGPGGVNLDAIAPFSQSPARRS